MLLQSFEGIIRLFPAFPDDGKTSAEFVRLRAHGGFLISASWNGSAVISPVILTSTVGGKVVFENPYLPLAVCVNGTALRGNAAEFEAKVNSTYVLARCEM